MPKKEVDKQFRKWLGAYPEAVVVYQDGMIRYVNDACVALVGAESADEIIGRKISEFTPEEFHPLIKKQEGELTEEGKSVGPDEEQIIRMDGTAIDVKVTGLAIDNGDGLAFLFLIHDLTERKRAEEAQRKSEELYRIIAENMTDLVCIVNMQGYFLYASPSHVTVLGYPGDFYEGKWAKELMHEDDQITVRQNLNKMIKTKEREVLHFRFRNTNGDWVWLEGKATPIFNEDGSFKHFLIVSRDMTERLAYEEKLSHMAYHDVLTGLPNRRLFTIQFDQALKEAEQFGRRMAVLFMDIDNFKAINDTMGHDAGDELLMQYASRIQASLRKSDLFSRQGGDEFIILLTNIENEENALQITERILDGLQAEWEIAGRRLQVTSSIGIAFYPADGLTRDLLLKKADIALYEAKKAGRNTFKTYSKR